MLANRRCVAVTVLLLLVAGLLLQMPLGLSTIRLGPLSVLWWYAVLVAPAVAAGVAMSVLSVGGRKPE